MTGCCCPEDDIALNNRIASFDRYKKVPNQKNIYLNFMKNRNCLSDAQAKYLSVRSFELDEIEQASASGNC